MSLVNPLLDNNYQIQTKCYSTKIPKKITTKQGHNGIHIGHGTVPVYTGWVERSSSAVDCRVPLHLDLMSIGPTRQSLQDLNPAGWLFMAGRWLFMGPTAQLYTAESSLEANVHVTCRSCRYGWPLKNGARGTRLPLFIVRG